MKSSCAFPPVFNLTGGGFICLLYLFVLLATITTLCSRNSVVDGLVLRHGLDTTTTTTHQKPLVQLPMTRMDHTNFVSTVLVDGHWMAKALKKYHNVPPPLSSSSSWGIQKDPFGGGDTVLLNPDIASTDVTDIEESLAFTTTPQ